MIKNKKDNKILKRVLSLCLVLMLAVTSVHLFFPVGAETIEHTHIWATKYDSTNHWEYCTVCGEKRNVTTHAFTDHWLNDKIAHCDGSNYDTRTCNCGYSYKYRESHEPSGWCQSISQGIHYKYCKKCRHYVETALCRDKNLQTLSCVNYGTCTVCGAVYDKPYHCINGNGTCSTCKTHVLDIYNEKTTFSADHTILTWTATVKPIDGHTMSLNNAATGYWNVLGNWSWISHTSSKNSDGSITYTNVIKINEKFQEKGYMYFAVYGSVDGYTIGGINFNGFNYYSDIEAPVQNDVVQKDQASANGWATIKQLTLSGIENASDTVYLTVSDKITGEKYVTDAAVSVTDGKYSYTCTPPIEGDESGRTYVVTAKDRIGNVSTKEFVVSKTDGSAPQIKGDTSLSYTDWSTLKNISLSFFDFGSLKTNGTAIDDIMPPVSRFGGGRAKKKQSVIEKLNNFFDKYIGLV